MELFSIIAQFLLFLLLNFYIVQCETGDNVRLETIHGLKVKFQWYFNLPTINNYKDAQKYCRNKKLHLVYSEHLKYFYKTLQPSSVVDGKNENVQFYIYDVLESTLDYPSHESGEKMCIIIEKQLNSNLMKSVKVEPPKSCSKKVNTVVCSNSPVRYAKVTPFEPSNDRFCLSTNVCYVVIGCTCGVIVILLMIIVNLCLRRRNAGSPTSKSVIPLRTQQTSIMNRAQIPYSPDLGSATQYDLTRLDSPQSPLLQLMSNPHPVRYAQSPHTKRRKTSFSNGIPHNSRGYNSDGASKTTSIDNSEPRKVICKHSFE